MRASRSIGTTRQDGMRPYIRRTGTLSEDFIFAMADTFHAPVLIIGSGPAGYTAAIYTARASLSPMLVTGMEPGGQMTITTDVENYPGFADVIQGPWLMEQMQKQAEHVGTAMHNDLIVDVDFTSRPFRCTGRLRQGLHRRSGCDCDRAQARWLGLPTEEKFQGFGVSACATCDGFFYRGRKSPWWAAEHGGRGSAVPDQSCDEGDADPPARCVALGKILQDRLFAHEKIEVVWDSVVEEVVGDETRSESPASEFATSRPILQPTWRWTGCLSPSGTIRRRSCFAAISISTTRAIS